MFTRDLSGTIFSLVMIVVLVVSMYLLMKHRMQVQSRYLSRRSDLLAACQFPSSFTTSHTHPTAAGAGGPLSARRVELVPHPHHATMDAMFPFARGERVLGDGGPPPYIPPGQHRSVGGRRAQRQSNEALPPLPTYEDATKLPALVHGGVASPVGEVPGVEAGETTAVETEEGRVREQS